MTAAAQPYRRMSALPVLIWIIITIIALFGVMQMSMTHAVERHGDIAYKIEECYNSGNVLMKWQKQDGRFMYGCEVPDGDKVCFAVVVTDAADEIITCIPKEKYKRLEQLIRYMINSGGKEVW